MRPAVIIAARRGPILNLHLHMMSIHLKHSTDVFTSRSDGTIPGGCDQWTRRISMPGSLITALRKAFLEFYREQAYCDLMALDDHSLADIGLRPEVMAGTTRSSLQHQAHRAVVDEYFRSL
jgi:uncharacterized protein YjiS (DUF1127 family)